MVAYTKDKQTGRVHYIRPTGQDEFTLCGFSFIDGGDAGSVDGVTATGPATCPDCINDLREFRTAFKGVRTPKLK